MKVECVANYPTPMSAKEVKSFLELVGYIPKFIKDFSKKAKPLTNLLKQSQLFTWSDLYQDVFNFFKEVLTRELLFQHPDFNKLFSVTTNASNIAIGTILPKGKSV